MTTLTQANKDAGHKMLDQLIDMVRQAAIDACKAGEDDARDKLYEMLGHLYMAKSVGGSVTASGVSTRSGDK